MNSEENEVAKVNSLLMMMVIVKMMTMMKNI